MILRRRSRAAGICTGHQIPHQNTFNSVFFICSTVEKIPEKQEINAAKGVGKEGDGSSDCFPRKNHQ